MNQGFIRTALARIFGGRTDAGVTPATQQYVTKYSGTKTKRKVMIFGVETELCLNEEGGIDYSGAELAAMSICCAGCGRRIFIGSPIGRVNKGDDLPMDAPLALWPDDPPSFVGCVGCLEMGIADAIGKWMPKEGAPLEAESRIIPFEQIMGDRLQYHS